LRDWKKLITCSGNDDEECTTILKDIVKNTVRLASDIASLSPWPQTTMKL